MPAGSCTGRVVVVTGAGNGIGQELTVFVPIGADAHGDPVKVCRLNLRNDSPRPRQLSVTYFVEWVLGSTREDMQRHVRTTWDADSGAIPR